MDSELPSIVCWPFNQCSPPGQGEAGMLGVCLAELAEGRGWLSFSSHPCQHCFFLLRPRKADHQFSSLSGPQPRTRTFLGRDLRREFHIGNAQVRRNADGCVPGTTPRMGVRLCSPVVIRVSPRCPAPPAGGLSAGLARPGPAPPASGEMQT